MSLDKMPLNWFDMLIVVTLLVGVQRGRTRGMSEELFAFLTWVAIVAVCGFMYQPIALMVSQSASVSMFLGNLLAYLGLAIVVAGIFAAIKKSVGGKLSGSDTFGGGEFYLGMMAGLVRFACILIFGLALLNSRAYTQAEKQADIAYQKEVYGSTFFPKLYTIQAQVFEESLTGPWIRRNLSILLIQPTSAAPEPKQQPKSKQKQYASP